MNLNSVTSIAHWNPQFFREIKGVINSRNLLFTGAISLLAQILTLVFFYLQMPVRFRDGINPIHRYCAGGNISSRYYGSPEFECVLGSDNSFVIHWPLWWFDIFNAFNWIIPLVLVLGGTYMLINNIGQEERRGTLNFIRLTPQTSQNILTGKILGVPILLYFAIGLAIPLHLWAAIQATIPFSAVLICYVLFGVGCSFFYSAAVLYALVGGSYAWLGSLFATALLWPSLLAFHGIADKVISILAAGIHPRVQLYELQELSYMGLKELRWFGLPLGENFALGFCFIILSISLGNYWIWQLSNRRFRNPNTTLMGKIQSYQWVAGINLWILGFVMLKPNLASVSADIGIVFLSTIAPLQILVLMAALSPQRQSLQDWARYKAEKITQKVGRMTTLALPTLFTELISGEKSPALLAVLINIAITAIVWIPWVLLLPDQNYFGYYTETKNEKALILQSFLLIANCILISTVITQLMLLIKVRKPQIWAAIAVAAYLAAPPMLLGILSLYPKNHPGLWLLTAIPFVSIQYAATTTVVLIILGQWSLLTLLTWQLTRRIDKLGESNSKALLAAPPTLSRSRQ